MVLLIAPEPYENIQVTDGERSFTFEDGELEVTDEQATAILALLTRHAPHLGIHVDGEEPEPVGAGEPAAPPTPAPVTVAVSRDIPPAEHPADTTSDDRTATPADPGGDLPARDDASAPATDTTDGEPATPTNPGGDVPARTDGPVAGETAPAARKRSTRTTAERG